MHRAYKIFVFEARETHPACQIGHINYEGDDVAHRQAHLNRYDAIMETTIACE